MRAWLYHTIYRSHRMDTMGLISIRSGGRQRQIRGNPTLAPLSYPALLGRSREPRYLIESFKSVGAQEWVYPALCTSRGQTQCHQAGTCNVKAGVLIVARSGIRTLPMPNAQRNNLTYCRTTTSRRVPHLGMGQQSHAQ